VASEFLNAVYGNAAIGKSCAEGVSETVDGGTFDARVFSCLLYDLEKAFRLCWGCHALPVSVEFGRR